MKQHRVSRAELRSHALAFVLLPSLVMLPGSPLFADTTPITGIDPTTGFRMERYRAPVPDHVPGGNTLTTAEVQAHLANGTLILIDVYPPKGLGPDPLDGHWVISEEHQNIAGSTWLPEVGRGFLEEGHEQYFRRNLDRLTAGDKAAPLLFFCTSDCWQSWNASRRAINWGYTNVNWYPLGNDGWQEQGGELVAAYPLNYLDDTLPAEAGVDSDLNANMDSDSDADEALDTALAFPAQMRIALIDQDQQPHEIGVVHFSATDVEGTSGISVDMNSGDFSDHFLSMRPFRCLADAAEWFCYLPYPYEIKNTVNADSLTDLEYHLLFIKKSPDKFGIDAWDGLYYSLALQADGTIAGKLLQGDLNVLANPPEPGSYPIDLNEFIADGSDERRFPAIIIRP